MDYSTATYFVTPIGFGCGTLLYLTSDSVHTMFEINEHLMEPYQTIISVLMLFSFIYFFLDFWAMIIWYKPSYKIYFVHHLVGLIAIPLMWYHYYMIKYIMGYLSFEISTPFFNMAWPYRRQNIVNSYIKFMEYTFVATYTLVRILFGSYLTFCIVHTIWLMNYPRKFAIVLPIVMQFLSYWWYYRIIRIVFGKSRTPKTD